MERRHPGPDQQKIGEDNVGVSAAGEERPLEENGRAVLRLLAGEELETVAAESGFPALLLLEWKESFVHAGLRALGQGEASGSEAESGVGDGREVVSLALLGQAVVEVGPEETRREIALPLKRCLHLLAFLALSPDFKASKGDIIEALWPDASEVSVQGNFHPTLSLTRRAFAGVLGRKTKVIVQGHGVYGLDPAFHWQVDVLAFESSLEAGRRAVEMGRERLGVRHLARAWSLYRGGLLQAHGGAWLQERRESVYQGYLALLRQLGELYLRHGRQGEALDAFRALLVVEPLEEQMHVEVMGIYGAQGRRDLVRRQFVRLQELLKELNVEPMEETQERYHALMR